MPQQRVSLVEPSLNAVFLRRKTEPAAEGFPEIFIAHADPPGQQRQRSGVGDIVEQLSDLFQLPHFLWRSRKIFRGS